MTDYESWMPDFIGGLAKGIEGSRGMIEKAVSGLATDMVINPKVSATDTSALTAGGTTSAADTASGLVAAIKDAVSGLSGQNGDIVIPVYLGGTMLDEVIVNAQQRTNLRSGGR